MKMNNMTLGRLIMSCCIAAAMGALPGVAAAAMPTNECPVRKPTAASYTWNFVKEANNIFQDIQADAYQARYHATQLQTYARTSDVDWQVHADQLMALRSEINDMGRKLCRLESIRRVVAPWQQQAIDRLADNLRLMADNAQDALVFGSNNRKYLWSPTYVTYANNLARESAGLVKAASHAVEYAGIQREYRTLADEMATKGAS